MRTLKHTLIHPGLLYMFLVVGETGVPGGNLRRHGENMQTPHRKAPSRWELNPGPSSCEAQALTVRPVQRGGRRGLEPLPLLLHAPEVPFSLHTFYLFVL